MNVVPVEGQDAINNIRQPGSRELVVEVQSGDGARVEGASVTFFLPSTGPGGTFANGTNTLTAITGRDGRAAARGIRFTQTGRFEIRVIASYQGQTATAVMNETNVSGISASGGGGSSKKIWVIVAIGAAAGIGAAIAATHGGSGSASSSNAPIMITAGSPTVGGPH